MLRETFHFFNMKWGRRMSDKIYAIVYYSPHNISSMLDHTKYAVCHASTYSGNLDKDKKSVVYAFEEQEFKGLKSSAKASKVKTVLLFTTPEIARKNKIKILDAKLYGGVYRKINLTEKLIKL